MPPRSGLSFPRFWLGGMPSADRSPQGRNLVTAGPDGMRTGTDLPQPGHRYPEVTWR
jgi:hypothetical protein